MQTLLHDRICYFLFFLIGMFCNKYVLTTLGFQYPTIFQAWKTLVSLCITYSMHGNFFKSISVPQILFFFPSMLLNLASLFTGSISLARLPLPAFLGAQSASETIMLLFDNHLPNWILQISLSVKFVTFMLIVWYAGHNITTQVVNWLSAYTVCFGASKCLQFWYQHSNLRQASLTLHEREYLHDISTIFFLGITALIYGHHQHVYNEFPHLNRVVFYWCCVLSGISFWFTRKHLHILVLKDSKVWTEMSQLLARIITMLIAIQINEYPAPIMLWTCIITSVSGDLLFIYGSNIWVESKKNYSALNDISIIK